MVQGVIWNRGACRPFGVPSKTSSDSSNDDENRARRLSVTESPANAVPMSRIQALLEYCSEVTYRLDSGKVFRHTRTHPEPQEVRNEDSLTTSRPSRPSAYAVEDSDREDTESNSGQARGLPRVGRRGPTPKRKRPGSRSSTPPLRTKRRPATNRRGTLKSDDDSDDDEEPDELEGAETELRQIRVDEVHRWFEIAFRLINQLACKDIVKFWIKFCHPKKQTSHPYNGGKRYAERSVAEYGYLGHYTMPDYWPSDLGWKKQTGIGCRHKEPDHIKKPERLKLLVHLLRCERRGFRDGKFNFSLKNLKQSTNGIHLESERNWTTGYVERLAEIYRVRAKEMEFERGEIDGDTLVNVQMPKPRGKARKAPKPAVKAGQVASPASGKLKKEPEEPSSIKRNAPVANMGVVAQTETEDLDISGESELSILLDTCSSTEDVAPGASCPAPSSFEARTIPHGLPFSISPSPTDRQNWTPQSANLARDRPTFTHPNPFGPIATPCEGQRSLPLRDQCYFGASPMHGFPAQAVPRPYNHASTASSLAAPRPHPHRQFPRTALPPRPIAPKVENMRHPTFSASSSGLAGAFDPQPNSDLWRAQIEPPPYTTVADPNASLYPFPDNTSFGTAYSDPTLSGGLPLDSWQEGTQAFTAPFEYQQGLGEDLQPRLDFQAAGEAPYQPLCVNATSAGGADVPSDGFLYTPDYRSQFSLSTEHNFDPFAQDHR
ncbi:hypothetical protein IMSHALPRED_000186 [Imshaugia aleurites]|uniref:Subtelomeric hrmA-associated cluster protein AFUB-079030/YDR124W-like helical bundle domain-containing protein n=1 Tax=Imshaugia aleurites TaxID=172621 RepID=A0A8H3EFS4_9LECA|nr:hypothetical protein IMSHALPRED_000186 [Imshaugia aleurites]